MVISMSILRVTIIPVNNPQVNNNSVAIARNGADSTGSHHRFITKAITTAGIKEKREIIHRQSGPAIQRAAITSHIYNGGLSA